MALEIKTTCVRFIKNLERKDTMKILEKSIIQTLIVLLVVCFILFMGGYLIAHFDSIKCINVYGKGD